MQFVFFITPIDINKSVVCSICDAVQDVLCHYDYNHDSQNKYSLAHVYDLTAPDDIDKII